MLLEEFEDEVDWWQENSTIPTSTTAGHDDDVITSVIRIIYSFDVWMMMMMRGNKTLRRCKVALGLDGEAVLKSSEFYRYFGGSGHFLQKPCGNGTCETLGCASESQRLRPCGEKKNFYPAKAMPTDSVVTPASIINHL